MPKTTIKQDFELQTRGITKVDAEITITVNGRELPSIAVLGGALEKAIAGVQSDVVESYKTVPARI